MSGRAEAPALPDSRIAKPVHGVDTKLYVHAAGRIRLLEALLERFAFGWSLEHH